MRLIYVIILTVISMALASQNVTENEVKLAATKKVVQLSSDGNYLSIIKQTPIRDIADKVIFTVFELLPKGYVVVTNNKQLPPIIAYSLENNIEISENSPLINMLRSDITQRLEYCSFLSDKPLSNYKNQWVNLIEGNSRNEDFIQWPPSGTTSTGGWIETNYTQSYPYNQFCPIDPITSNRSYVGCPATAMAQIVNYYRTTNNTIFTDADDYYHSYAGRNYWIDDDYKDNGFLSFPEINTLLDSISVKFNKETTITNEEAAALSFACGIAAYQVFTSEGSGTFGVNQAMDAYLKFGFNDAVLIYDNDTSLFTTMSQNMKDARPAHLAVVNEASTSGHNVVLDGYNTDDYYHINFGWGGSNNGWYLLPQEFPLGLTVIEGVVADIAYPPVYTGVDYNIADFHINIYPNPATSNITIYTNEQFNSDVQIKLFDLSGRKLYDESAINEELNGCKINIDFTDKLSDQLDTGLYLLIIESDRIKISKKVLFR